MYVYGSGEKDQTIIMFSTQNSSKQFGLCAALIKTTHSEIILFAWKIKHMHSGEELIIRSHIIIVTTSFTLVHVGLTRILYISIYLQKY